MSLLEVCISSDDIGQMADNIATAIEYGAKRFELCGQMQHEGLTPSASAIEVAKQLTRGKAHLAVMIRPRAGDFNYARDEITVMVEQIALAAKLGADSVVFGASHNGELAKEAIETLVSACSEHQVDCVFHRAFDTLSDPVHAINWLAAQGVKRILTAGTPWGSNAPLEQGVAQINGWMSETNTNIEFIIGGGLTHNNLGNVLLNMANNCEQVSLHTHSAVLKNGKVCGQLVANMARKIAQATSTKTEQK